MTDRSSAERDPGPRWVVALPGPVDQGSGMTDRISAERDGGPLWIIADPNAGPPSVSSAVRAMRSRGARSWYIGASISLVWLVQIVPTVLEVSTSGTAAALGVGATALFALGFLVSAPIQSVLPLAGRVLVSAGLLLLSLLLTPWLGLDTPDLWTYIGVSIAMAGLRWRATIISLTVLSLIAIVFEAQQEGWTGDVWRVAGLIFSISMMMAAFAKMQATAQRLRAAQQEVESLAAERERTRMARDIHDILGHSLTVVTVKAELAARLVDLDPERAKTEIAEVQSLARAALADVRTTVAGSRGVTLSGELAAARAALEAAGVDAELPTTTDLVPERCRELAGWIVREGVTNVLRHAGAARCRVRLAADEVEIADDGVGPSAAAGGSSTGLTGLRERVESAGGRLSIGRSDLGGFSLRATFGKART